MAYPQMEPLGGFMAGMFQGQQAKDAEAEARLKQQQDLQTMLFAQQKQPLELQKFADDSAHTRALTGQAAETTRATGLANKMAEETYDSRRQAFIDDAVAKHSLAEIEARHKQNQLDLWSDDPAKVAAAKKKFENSTEILKRKMELDSAYASAANVATIGATSRENVQKTKTGAGGDWRTQLLATKGKPVEQYSVLMAASADPSISAADQQTIQAMLVKLHPIANAALTRVKPGEFVQDKDGTWVPNPAVANPGIPEPTASASAAPTKTYTQADLEYTAKKHGMTVEQVKAKLGLK